MTRTQSCWTKKVAALRCRFAAAGTSRRARRSGRCPPNRRCTLSPELNGDRGTSFSAPPKLPMGVRIALTAWFSALFIACSGRRRGPRSGRGRLRAVSVGALHRRLANRSDEPATGGALGLRKQAAEGFVRRLRCNLVAIGPVGCRDDRTDTHSGQQPQQSQATVPHGNAACQQGQRTGLCCRRGRRARVGSSAC